MTTWESFKKKMFKKNKNFEKDFKEIEKIKIIVKIEDNKEVLNQLKDLSDLTEIFK